MDLQQLRLEIDKIDNELVTLFCQRMEIAAKIAEYKKENGLPIFVPRREQEKLADVANKAGTEMARYAQSLYETIFTLSRNYQSEVSA